MADKDRVRVALRRAVRAALERKRRLGQYSVLWRDNRIVIQGEDAPPGSCQKAGIEEPAQDSDIL